MNTKPKIIEKIIEINDAYLQLIEHNVRIIYKKKNASYRKEIMDSIEPCCDDKQLELLYNLYDGFIDTYPLDSMEDKIALNTAILFMYYNMVLIETHDNELLSTNMLRNDNGKIMSPHFLTIKNIFMISSIFDGLNREPVYKKFIEFYTKITTSDEQEYSNIRRFLLGPTFG